MTRFTLAVMPDGRAILTTREGLTSQQAEYLRDAVKGWENGRWPVLVIQDCETVQVTSFDLLLELGEPPPPPPTEARPAVAPRPPRDREFASAAEVRHEQLAETPPMTRASGGYWNPAKGPV